MKVVSVNIAQPKEIEHEGKKVLTGIFKQPVNGAVLLNTTGLAGDGQADLSVHGGVDKAAYAYPVEHYDYWAEQLQRTDFSYGQFGETLTIDGISEQQIAIGDRLQIGGALLEVSQPRTPCFKLGIRMGRKDFTRMFQDSGRVGFYLRVIESGPICAGDAIDIISRYQPSYSVTTLWQWSHLERQDRHHAATAVALEPLAASWKERFAKRLRG